MSDNQPAFAHQLVTIEDRIASGEIVPMKATELAALRADVERLEKELERRNDELEQVRESHATTRGLARNLTTVLEKRNAEITRLKAEMRRMVRVDVLLRWVQTIDKTLRLTIGRTADAIVLRLADMLASRASRKENGE
jgi:chromosome segregation ATPase